MKMTSAYANKMLKQLMEDKGYWTEKERNSIMYTAAINEEPVVPEYDYKEVARTIADLDKKICILKHAISKSNVSAQINVAGTVVSVDEILVTMAQLNNRKGMLDFMRKQQPQTRKESHSYGNRGMQPEYQYINYDLELVKEDFETVSKDILQLQMALDKYNQTVEFEVEI